MIFYWESQDIEPWLDEIHAFVEQNMEQKIDVEYFHGMRICVALENNQMVGVVCWNLTQKVPWEMPFVTTQAYIAFLAVDVDHRRQGIAKQLLRMIFCAHPSWALHANLENKPFYEKLGFQMQDHRGYSPESIYERPGQLNLFYFFRSQGHTF
jgi:ribosomal protein S18 acetylase RimI-like enzyme